MKIRRELESFRRLTNAKFGVVQKSLNDLQTTMNNGFTRLGVVMEQQEKEIAAIKKRRDKAGL